MADTVEVSTIRKLLLAVLLVSLTGSAFGAGTFASFNATTTNQASTFATGTLLLSNNHVTGNTCFSNAVGNGAQSNAEVDDNINGTCDALFTTTTSKPGDMATIDLILSNTGTIDASSLSMVVTACTTATPGAFHGSVAAKICAADAGLKIQVQEYTASGRTGGGSAVAKCIFPVAAGAACAGNYGFVGNGFAGTTFSTFNTAGITNSGGAKYITFTINFPGGGNVTSDNQYQGLSAAFGITWTITQ